MQALAAMRSGPSAASIAEARRVACEAGESEFMVPTLVIHGDRDTTVNPVNADLIIEQLQARAECIDPGGGAVLVSDEYRIESGERPVNSGTTRNAGGSCCARFWLKDWVMHGAVAIPAMRFNEADGPDASRLIVDFVMQYRRRTVFGSRGSTADSATLPAQIGG